MFLLFAAGAYLSWQLIGQAQAMIAAGDDLAIQKNLLAEAETEYQQEVARMEALGFDINLIKGTLATYEDFEAGRVPVLAVIDKIGEALGTDLRLDRLIIDQIPAPAPANAGAVEQAPAQATLEARLSLSFPQTVEIEAGMKEVNNFERRLRSLLPGYDVSITQQIGRPVYTEQLKGVAGRTAEEIAAAEDYMAELVIRGPKQ